MPFQSEIHEIEEAIDAFSELRVRLEKNNPDGLAVLELTRLELSLHERARVLRRADTEKAGRVTKGKKAAVDSKGRKESSGKDGAVSPSSL